MRIISRMNNKEFAIWLAAVWIISFDAFLLLFTR